MPYHNYLTLSCSTTKTTFFQLPRGSVIEKNSPVKYVQVLTHCKRILPKLVKKQSTIIFGCYPSNQIKLNWNQTSCRPVTKGQCTGCVRTPPHKPQRCAF